MISGDLGFLMRTTSLSYSLHVWSDSMFCLPRCKTSEVDCTTIDAIQSTEVQSTLYFSIWTEYQLSWYILPLKTWSEKHHIISKNGINQIRTQFSLKNHNQCQQNLDNGPKSPKDSITNIICVHCFIHSEALVARSMPSDQIIVTDTEVKTVNSIMYFPKRTQWFLFQWL